MDADFPLAEPGDAVEQPQPIALQGSDLERAQVGDSVALPLPDGSTLQARVTKVELQRGGERNWQGKFGSTVTAIRSISPSASKRLSGSSARRKAVTPSRPWEARVGFTRTRRWIWVMAAMTP